MGSAVLTVFRSFQLTNAEHQTNVTIWRPLIATAVAKWTLLTNVTVHVQPTSIAAWQIHRLLHGRFAKAGEELSFWPARGFAYSQLNHRRHLRRDDASTPTSTEVDIGWSGGRVQSHWGHVDATSCRLHTINASPRQKLTRCDSPHRCRHRRQAFDVDLHRTRATTFDVRKATNVASRTVTIIVACRKEAALPTVRPVKSAAKRTTMLLSAEKSQRPNTKYVTSRRRNCWRWTTMTKVRAYCHLNVNGKSVHFMLDCSATVKVLPFVDASSVNLSLTALCLAEARLTMFDGQELKTTVCTRWSNHDDSEKEEITKMLQHRSYQLPFEDGSTLCRTSQHVRFSSEPPLLIRDELDVAPTSRSIADRPTTQRSCTRIISHHGDQIRKSRWTAPEIFRLCVINVVI